KLTTIKECITEYVRNCSDGDVEDEYLNQEYRQNMTEDDLQREENWIHQVLKDDEMFLDAVAEICQADSELHANIVPDIFCYKETFEINIENGFCRNYTDNALNFLQDLTDKMNRERNDEFDHQSCLRNLFEINCFVNEINKNCSPLAKDTFLEIIQKGFNVVDRCPVPIFPEIQELLDSFESERNEDIYVRKLLVAD
ncbi:unnamed protein product, partial [Larinioides sclopetarius]